jgi:hypothetical protein
MEAIHIMNESTMVQACDLLLSERDYQQTQGNGGDNDDDEEPSDQDKLLELFSKCKTALKVISKQQATLSSLSNTNSSMMPGAPNLGAPLPLSRGTSTTPRVVGIPKLKPKTSSSKQGMVPMRRTVNRTAQAQAQAGTIIPGPINKPIKRPLERERSDESALRDDVGAGASSSPQQSSNSSTPSTQQQQRQSSSSNHKKLKVSPTASRSLLAPPPGALNFLAKLNKDPSVAVPMPVAAVVPKETKAPPTERRKNPGRVNRRSSA